MTARSTDGGQSDTSGAGRTDAASAATGRADTGGRAATSGAADSATRDARAPVVAPAVPVFVHAPGAVVPAWTAPLGARVLPASALQVVAVAPPDALAATRRAVLYAPGLGEVWVAAPTEVTAALGERAAGVTRQRRRFERTRARLERERHTASPQRAERALVSDAYLAGLLEVLPDAVCSVDGAGRVLSANAAAERRFGGPGCPPTCGRWSCTT